MATEIIELRARWPLGDALRQGGFGRVYETVAEDGSLAVIKLVPKAPGASRELLFEPISGLPNIVPILDSGEWRDYYVLVMPRAEKSLRRHIIESGGTLPSGEVLDILSDVAEALASLQHDVVHRDLKPENILLYQGRWCLADFGIARYAEATTSPDTRKHSFTRPYASPEQWRFERATPAADVYAFGVLAFELLQGHWPFPGPDFREQHLNQPSPPLVGCPPALATLVTECLFKPPQARPTPANILARLQASQRPSSSAAARLQAANQKIVDGQAKEGAAMSAQSSTEERRSALAVVAGQSLETILDRLVEDIRDNASAAAVTRAPNLRVRLGQGELSVNAVKPAPSGCLVGIGRPPAFDVIAYTAITVRQPRDEFAYEGRSHSLWYCDAYDEGIYRWFETAFMVQALIPERGRLDPFALPPTDEEAALAFAPILATRQIAWQPLPFDQGEEEQFIERWIAWLADAANGTLRHPRSMPEDSGGRYRKSS